MSNTLNHPRVAQVLADLYTDAEENDPLIRKTLAGKNLREISSAAHYEARANLYMPINPDFGTLLYSLVRSSSAKSIVEFGTSLGISTIYLAAAVQDNGAGSVITTELVAEKAKTARTNLAQTRLEHLVDFRIGDALTTLTDSLPEAVDILFLDGEKSLYLDILKLLEPNLKSGSMVISDNTDKEGLEAFLGYLRAPQNGYLSTAIFTDDAGVKRSHELSIRI